MSKLAKILSFCLFITLFAVAVPTYAGILDGAKNWLSTEVIAFLASAVAVLVSGLMGVMYTKAVRTFREAGEFLNVLGMALEDKRITREELAQIIREGRDVFRTWR